MFRSTLLLLLTLITFSSPVRSQSSVDPAFFNGLRYRLVGPARGGRVTTVTGVPSQPKTFYMGAASGGLFRTTDGGATWTQTLFVDARLYPPLEIMLAAQASGREGQAKEVKSRFTLPDLAGDREATEAAHRIHDPRRL